MKDNIFNNYKMNEKILLVLIIIILLFLYFLYNKNHKKLLITFLEIVIFVFVWKLIDILDIKKYL
jgi:hypothetical protein